MIYVEDAAGKRIALGAARLKDGTPCATLGEYTLDVEAAAAIISVLAGLLSDTSLRVKIWRER